MNAEFLMDHDRHLDIKATLGSRIQSSLVVKAGSVADKRCCSRTSIWGLKEGRKDPPSTFILVDVLRSSAYGISTSVFKTASWRNELEDLGSGGGELLWFHGCKELASSLPIHGRGGWLRALRTMIGSKWNEDEGT